MYWWLFLLCPVAYLIGGINNAKTITKARHVDLTTVGSGNAGATNVGRALGFWWFLLVTVLDVLKGAIVAFIGYIYCSLTTGNYSYTVDHYTIMLAMGLSAIVGSIFPVWYKFKGGKGIATWVGLGFALNPLLMVLDAVLYIPLLFLTRLMSLSTLLGVATWALLAVVSLIPPVVPVTVPIIVLYCGFVVVLFFAHRKNIGRLLTGKEKKMFFKKKSSDIKNA